MSDNRALTELPTQAEIDAAMRRGRRLQAHAFRHLLRSAAGGVRNLFRSGAPAPAAPRASVAR